jgi:hypothetical protein
MPSFSGTKSSSMSSSVPGGVVSPTAGARRETRREDFGVVENASGKVRLVVDDLGRTMVRVGTCAARVAFARALTVCDVTVGVIAPSRIIAAAISNEV